MRRPAAGMSAKGAHKALLEGAFLPQRSPGRRRYSRLAASRPKALESVLLGFKGQRAEGSQQLCTARRCALPRRPSVYQTPAACMDLSPQTETPLPAS